MTLTIFPSQLSGMIRVPASKSLVHRALFLAALADAETEIRAYGLSEDIRASIRAIEALGARVQIDDERITVSPVRRDQKREEPRFFDCGESGTTLRFVLPMIGVLGLSVEIKTHGRLGFRPLAQLGRELTKKGMAIDQTGIAVEATGQLGSGVFTLPGDVSSQYISSILQAMPLLADRCELVVEGERSSSGYIDLTMDMMKTFGVEPVTEGARYISEPVGAYHSPGRVVVEGDWSSASFWCAANALGAQVELTGLDRDSQQADRLAETYIRQILAGGATIDIDQTPDLLPVLAVVAAVRGGHTNFVHAARLRDKESDRLQTTADMIRALGGSCDITDDAMTVTACPDGQFNGGRVDAQGDHRIAMSAAIASLVCREPVRLDGVEACAKSYPGFWEDLAHLGGKTDA